MDAGAHLPHVRESVATQSTEPGEAKMPSLVDANVMDSERFSWQLLHAAWQYPV
jgi:hypothetical protein